MAGQPKWRALCARLEEFGGEDAVLDLVRDGETIVQIARRFDTSRSQMYRWLALTEPRKRKFQLAREEQASALAEEGLDILDNTADAENPAAVQSARARAEYRRWMASVLDRSTYGKGPDMEVHVNVGQLHLDALRQQVSGAPQRAEVGPGEPIVDGEWEEDVEVAGAQE